MYTPQRNKHPSFMKALSKLSHQLHLYWKLLVCLWCDVGWFTWSLNFVCVCVCVLRCMITGGRFTWSLNLCVCLFVWKYDCEGLLAPNFLLIKGKVWRSRHPCLALAVH